MPEHLNEETDLTNRLTAMGETLKEHWVVAMLLSSLPGSYNSLITALESYHECDPTLEYVKGKLFEAPCGESIGREGFAQREHT